MKKIYPSLPVRILVLVGGGFALAFNVMALFNSMNNSDLQMMLISFVGAWVALFILIKFYQVGF